jgi:hypothetical protein
VTDDDLLPITGEILVDGVWTDITDDVVGKGSTHITIRRGRLDQADAAKPSRCVLRLNNASGKYSPRWPHSPYFRRIGRNTPLRVCVCTGLPYLWAERQPTTVSSHGALTTPDHASLDVTGDLDIRVDVSVAAWSPTDVTFASKWTVTGDQRAWYLRMSSNGKLGLSWSSDGTSATVKLYESTVRVPWWVVRHMRVTLDVDNGAGGHTVTFYTSVDGSTWVPLGDPVTGTGTTAVFASTSDLRVGGRAPITTHEGARAQWRRFQLRNGINGPVVAEADVAAQAVGVASWVDSAGRTWTVNTSVGAEVTNRRVRFVGAVKSWPQRWDGHGDGDGEDAWVPVEAYGVLRRLEKTRQLRSALYRGLTSPGRPEPVAYWPCEEGEDAKSIAPAVGNRPMVITGVPQMAAFTDLPASDPLPKLGSAKFTAAIPVYQVGDETAIRLVMDVPASVGGTRVLTVLRCTGTARDWQLRIDTSGNLELRVYDDDGTTLYNSGFLAYAVNASTFELKLQLVQNGSNIDWAFGTATITDAGELTFAETTGTLNNRTVGRVTSFTVAPNKDLTEVAVGHITFAADKDRWDGYHESLVAWQGEAAGRRIERLCAEEGVPFVGIGDLNATAAMGPQRSGQLTALWQEAADADGGPLFETRYEAGLTYRTRQSLYNQVPRLELDYSQRHLSPPLEPDEDDDQAVNDVTVERRGGSSARSVQEAGPLNIQDPQQDPDGIGRYDESVSLSLAADSQLPSQAGWRRHTGTWDDARFSAISVSPALNTDLTMAIADVDCGDRITAGNPPAPLPPDEIDAIAQGYEETTDGVEWDITLNATPGGPWWVFVLEDPVHGRLDTSGSYLAQPVTSSTTTFLVATDSGKQLWITSTERPQNFPFAATMGGEVVKVNSITGDTSPQLWTVDRSLNGVAKAHPAGTRVRLARVAVAS